MVDSPLGGGGSRQEAIERLAHHLRGMRAGLEQYTSGHRSSWPDARQRWNALLDRYDAALVEASMLLGVRGGQPTVPEGGPRLSEDDRAELERGLRPDPRAR